MDTKTWFLVAIVTIVHSRDLSEGSQNGGSKIFSENKKANPAIWRQMENITISGDEGAKINKILVTDLREEKDGEARIVEGGIGQRNVTLELKSPTALRGYDFHVEVYANSDNEQAQSTGHDRFKQKTNPATSLMEDTTVKASPSVPVSLSKQETSSLTSEQVHEESINGRGGKRLNRDAEEKDNSNKQLNNSQFFTDVTTEVPELKATSNPTNKDKREDRTRTFPQLNKVPEQGITNEPSIHLHETNKMPESTARSILSRDFKITEEKQQHEQSHDDFEEKNKQTTINMNEKRTNINYPQFNVREITPAFPVVNAPLPTVEDGHKRHTRDVNNHNTPVVEITEHPLPSSTFRNQGNIHSSPEIKVPSDQAQRDHRENGHAIPSEFNLKKIGNNQGEENVRTDKVEEKRTLTDHQNHNNAFKGRYVPDRFARNPVNSGSANSETSTEINKTLPQSIARSKSVNLNVNSGQYSTPPIPEIISNGPTTNKPETITGKQVNPEINSNQHISTNKRSTSSEEITAHKRVTRDTADKNNKGQASVLLTDNLKRSTASQTTLKPEINGNSALDINGSTVNNSNDLKTPVKISSDKENTNKHDTPTVVRVETEDKQRNARGTDANKEDGKLSTLSSSTKSEHKESREEKVSTVDVPIEPKSTTAANIKRVPIDAAKEKERISRDVNNVQKSNHNDNEKIPSSTEAVIEKGTVKLDEKAVKDDKASSKGEKDQKGIPTTVPSNVESTIKGEIIPIISRNPIQDDSNLGVKNSQPEKFTREIKKTDLEGSITLTNGKNITSKIDTNLNTTNKPSSTITPNKDKIEEPKQPEKSVVLPQ